MSLPTVFVVDDNEADVASLERILSAEGLNACVFSTAQRFLDTCLPSQAGCLVAELHVAGTDCLQLQQTLLDRGIALPVIILTRDATVESAVASMRAGAIDVIQKPATTAVLVARVREAIESDQAARQKQAELDGLRRRFDRLSQREVEVLNYLADGLSLDDIASQLGTQYSTVKHQRSSMLKKLEASTVGEAVRLLVTVQYGEN